MRVAIIGGSGKMGQWFARLLLKEGKEVIITGRNESKLLEARQELGVEATSNAEAVKWADAVLLSVTIDNLGEVVAEIGPYIRPGQVVIDITSIKVPAVDAMHRHITRGVTLGVHPMFGPGAQDITGQNFVLTPTSDEERALARKVREYLETRGARVTTTTPREHDELMAAVIGLPHFIALISADTLLNLDRLGLMKAAGGTTYKVLLTLVESVISEDPELYSFLQMNLPDVAGVEELFQKSLNTWLALVQSKDRQGFVNRMSMLNSQYKAANDGGRDYAQN